MSEHRHIPEPGELIYMPKPSWAPAFFALGALGLVCGIYAAGFNTDLTITASQISVPDSWQLRAAV